MGRGEILVNNRCHDNRAEESFAGQPNRNPMRHDVRLGWREIDSQFQIGVKLSQAGVFLPLGKVLPVDADSDSGGYLGAGVLARDAKFRILRRGSSQADGKCCKPEWILRNMPVPSEAR